MSYNVHDIEKKWKDYWSAHPVGQSQPVGSGKKFYCLDMFPYPSGSGLHVGHWRGYVLSDVYTRIKWLEGYNILHPMGWDAFGLPAENDALKKGIHPSISTRKNIDHFKEQLTDINALYDWSKEINTTDPEYYKWTQWIFIQMFKAGLAYESYLPINWCPSCLTGLANEEVVNSSCERCGTLVERQKARQWVLKITDYAEKLLQDLDGLQWPEKVKTMQRNWIGKSEGAQVSFVSYNPETDTEVDFSVYTTRPDTLLGVTFLAIAPDHEHVDDFLTSEYKDEADAYRAQYNAMTGVERLENMDTKFGIPTGSYAVHPLTHEKLPIYIANYVLKDYGTGIVMAVPAHDQRDFDFARTYDIEIKQVIKAPDSYLKDDQLVKAYEGEGLMMNSDFLNGYDARTEGQEKMMEYLTEHEIAYKHVQYKLRDWIFSRQRYWGEPIPLIHCDICGVVPVPEDQLPVKLPDIENYKPTGTQESPLADVEEWVNTSCPECDGPARRETNTMPQWAGSCWYFLRYPDPHNNEAPWTQEDLSYWLPVDLYVGGIEHAILHLLYARFYTKVLYDLGYVPFKEPFKQLFNQGMVTKYSEKSGTVEKMSKSKGNVVNPDDMVKMYGSDVLRMYILFMGPPELDVQWQDAGLEGIKRFANRLYAYMSDVEHILPEGTQEDSAVTKRVHMFIKDFNERIALFKPNTALSSFMELLNDMQAQSMKLSHESFENIVTILSALAPCLASELLERVCHKKLSDCLWPYHKEELLQESEMKLVVQVKGRVRGTISVLKDETKEAIISQAEASIERWLEGKKIIKTIYIPGKIVNFVIA
jgi:leucyl-tRNA synthetase